MKGFLRIIILLILSVGCIEIYLRVVQPAATQYYWIQKTYHAFDPSYYVDLEPNVSVRVNHFTDFFTMKFSTNEMGFRATRKIDNSVPQVACIGDSITMGFGVDDEDTFCKKLDGISNSRGEKYTAINMAVDAYGPGAIALKLKKFLPQLNVKVLFYFASPGDDIDEIEFNAKKTDLKKFTMFKYQFLLTKHSYFLMASKLAMEQFRYRFIETFIWPLEKLKRTVACYQSGSSLYECGDVYFAWTIKGFFKEFVVSKPTPLALLKTEPIELPMSECKDAPDPFIIPPFLKQSIDSIIETAKQNNAKLVIAITPIDLETAYCGQKGKFHKYYEYPLALKKYLQEKQIDYFDMFDYVKEMKDEKGRDNIRPFYIYGDGHYTKLGHEWIFKKLEQKAKEVIE
jgi:hypothetical protein